MPNDNGPIHVRQIGTPTDAVLIRALGPNEWAGCAVSRPRCTAPGTLELAYYDPDITPAGDGDGNYCGALYACSVQHAVQLLKERSRVWLPSVAWDAPTPPDPLLHVNEHPRLIASVIDVERVDNEE
jgi:hypothetical protein